MSPQQVFISCSWNMISFKIKESLLSFGNLTLNNHLQAVKPLTDSTYTHTHTNTNTAFFSHSYCGTPTSQHWGPTPLLMPLPAPCTSAPYLGPLEPTGWKSVPSVPPPPPSLSHFPASARLPGLNSLCSITPSLRGKYVERDAFPLPNSFSVFWNVLSVPQMAATRWNVTEKWKKGLLFTSKKCVLSCRLTLSELLEVQCLA